VPELDVTSLPELGYSPQAAPAHGDRTTVSKDGFLRLLTTQLQHQDPLAPTDNTQFIAQLAQFQTLEGQLASNEALAEMVSLSRSQVALAGLTQAASLVGTNITWFDEASNASRSGQVDQVAVEDGVMTAYVDGTKVPLGLVTGVGRAADANADADASS
jgi:flagellar basal-body rod modification protein FlgD